MSSIKAKISEKANQLRSQNPKISTFKLYFSLLQSLVQGVYRVIMGKYYLRNCTKVGKMVSVNGKPLIKNQGELYLGDEVRIWSSITRAKIFVEPGAVLKIGRNSRVNGSHISAGLSVTIGENVRISPDVYIIDSDYHNVVDHFADGKKEAIIIEDNVWLASRCVILKGVTIGKGSVVATGAVVTKSVPAYTIVGGVPAKIIKKIEMPEGTIH